MAASVNRIAATFAAARGFPSSSSSPLPPDSSSSFSAAPSTAAFSASLSTTHARHISAFWNPDFSLSRSRRSSLLSLYGLPDPTPSSAPRGPPSSPLLRPPSPSVTASPTRSSPTLIAADPSARSPLQSSPALGRPSSWPYPARSSLRCALGAGSSVASIRLSPERLVKKAAEMRTCGVTHRPIPVGRFQKADSRRPIYFRPTSHRPNSFRPTPEGKLDLMPPDAR